MEMTKNSASCRKCVWVSNLPRSVTCKTCNNWGPLTKLQWPIKGAALFSHNSPVMWSADISANFSLSCADVAIKEARMPLCISYFPLKMNLVFWLWQCGCLPCNISYRCTPSERNAVYENQGRKMGTDSGPLLIQSSALCFGKVFAEKGNIIKGFSCAFFIFFDILQLIKNRCTGIVQTDTCHGN